MKADTIKAKQIMDYGKFTCVFCKEDKIYTSRQRGVKPLLELLDSNETFEGFCVSDKVVGNAAAFLYVLLGVCEVYAEVISKSALKTLDKNKTATFYGEVVDGIRNRTDTGPCPMEEATRNCLTAEEAEKAIRKKLEQLGK